MVWGFIITLLLVATCGFLIKSATNKKYGIVSWIVALVLWVVLSFETNGLIRAIDGRSQMADLVGTIIGSISGYTDYADLTGVISFQDANQIALGCKCVIPSYGKYFRASDFEGKTYGDIPAIISVNIDKAMRRSVWNSIGWILLTLVIGIVAMIVFMEKESGYSRRNRNHFEETSRDRRNTRYHSRRNL
jgi:hypothetical protein